MREETRGKVDADVNKQRVGYGYVKPTVPGAAECGGALFHTATRSVQEFQPHPIWFTDRDVSH